MPVARFEMPDGRIGRFEVPEGTTPEQAQQQIQAFVDSQAAANQDQGFLGAGVIEPAIAVATGAIAEPIAGIAGIAQAINPLAPEGAGAQAVEATREALTFQPRTQAGQAGLQAVGETLQPVTEALQTAEQVAGEAGFQAGGPVGGAIGAAVPTALLEATGLAAPAAAGKAVGRLSKTQAKKGADLTDEVERLREPTPEEGLAQVTETLQKGTEQDISALVEPDQVFFDAVDELGISVEPLASFGSQNPQFRAVEQGLASVPASQLDAQGKAFIGELSQKADDLIVEYGGTLDKAELSDRFRQESINAIDGLADETDKLYDTLAVRIPAATRVDAPNTVSFIRDKARELGGRQELPRLLNIVLRQLETTEKIAKSKRTDVVLGKPIPGKVTTSQPTHERLNQTRREVGQALNKRSGPFKDQETGLLKALYKRLRQDQDAIAADPRFEAAAISDSANALVRQRKHLEDNLSKLLGKDLEGSILPKVGQSLKKLAKGDVQKWDATMARIEPSMRQEIVVTALNDIFKGTNLGGKALNPTQFTKFMDDLDRQPAIKKRLFKELPEESIKSIEALRTVSRGISIALQDKIPTGRVAAFFDDNDGLLRRLMGKAISAAVTIKAGPLAASAANEFINQSSNGSKAASAVLASPQFQGMIRTAVRDGVTEGAQITAKLQKMEKAFQRSKQFKRWSEALTESESARLASLGPVAYLLQDQEQASDN